MKRVILVAAALCLAFVTEAMGEPDNIKESAKQQVSGSKYKAYRGRRHPHGGPPGQIQKATGYNPAARKYHPHGGPPGQTKRLDYGRKSPESVTAPEQMKNLDEKKNKKKENDSKDGRAMVIIDGKTYQLGNAGKLKETP